jgi:hypothetical protein
MPSAEFKQREDAAMELPSVRAYRYAEAKRVLTPINHPLHMPDPVPRACVISVYIHWAFVLLSHRAC